MTYLGKMQGGTLVFEGNQKPQDGTIVRVEPITMPADTGSVLQDGETIGQKLLKFAGVLDGPADGSLNVDHYLYGLPKK